MSSVPGQLQNCYRASEALYHALGGKEAGLTPMRIRHEGTSHWYLRWLVPSADERLEPEVYYIDPTSGQFDTPVPYHEGHGCGFLTPGPSVKAQRFLAGLARAQPKVDMRPLPLTAAAS